MLVNSWLLALIVYINFVAQLMLFINVSLCLHINSTDQQYFFYFFLYLAVYVTYL